MSVDIGVDIGAKFEASLGANTKALNDNTRMTSLATRAATPAMARMTLTGIVSAGGFAVLGGQQTTGPDMGFFWLVRSIVISGVDPSAAVTGTAYVYITAMDPPNNISTIAQCNTMDLRDIKTLLPSVAFYGRGEMPLRLNEEMYIAIAGSTAGIEIQASIQIENYQESSNGEGFGGR